MDMLVKLPLSGTFVPTFAKTGKTTRNNSKLVTIVVEYNTERYFHLFFIPSPQRQLDLLRYMIADIVVNRKETAINNWKKYGVSKNFLKKIVAVPTPTADKIIKAMQNEWGIIPNSNPRNTPFLLEQQFFSSILFIK
jgi:hypothetical protein